MTHTGHRPMTKAIQHRLKRKRAQSLLPGQEPLPNLAETKSDPASQVDLDCGWGHLLFGQTFDSPEALIDLLLNEEPDRRDIAFYIRDPHVLLTLAPQDIFLDPSHTFRLNLATYHPKSDPPKGFQVRRLCSENDAHGKPRPTTTSRRPMGTASSKWHKSERRWKTYYNPKP